MEATQECLTLLLDLLVQAVVCQQEDVLVAIGLGDRNVRAARNQLDGLHLSECCSIPEMRWWKESMGGWSRHSAYRVV